MQEWAWPELYVLSEPQGRGLKLMFCQNPKGVAGAAERQSVPRVGEKIFWDYALFKMENVHYFQTFAHVIEYC